MINFELFSEKGGVGIGERSRVIFSLQASSGFFSQANHSLRCFLPTWGTEEPWGEIQAVAGMEREAFD